MHSINDEYFTHYTKRSKVADPGASGTFKLNNISGGVVTLTATGTYTLPDAPKGVTLLVCCDDTSAITLADSGGTVHTFTGTSGTTAALMVATDDNSWDNVGSGGAVAAGDVTFASTLTSNTNLSYLGVELLQNTLTNTATPTALGTAGAGTLTAAAIVAGTVLRTGPTAAYTDTTHTAAQIVTATGAYAGDSGHSLAWIFYHKNTVAFPATIAGGSGVTVAGQLIVPPNSTGIFHVEIPTTADAVTITGIGNMPQANVKNAQFTTNATDTTITAAANTLTGAREVFYATTAAGAGGIALTTRTATEMFADISNCHIGYNWKLRIVSDGGGTVTLTPGTGVTITGTATVATNVWKDFCCTFTSATAVTLQNVGSGTVDATA